MSSQMLLFGQMLVNKSTARGAIVQSSKKKKKEKKNGFRNKTLCMSVVVHTELGEITSAMSKV